MSTLRIVSFNLQEGGLDEGNTRRWHEQMALLYGLNAGVICLQECHGWDRDGSELFYRAEKILAMRGLFAAAPRVNCHLAVFFDPGIIHPLRWDKRYTDLAWHAYAQARLSVAGLTEPLEVVSVHVSPWSPVDRLREAALIAQNIGKPTYGVAAGDFNGVPPGDSEPPWDGMPRYKQAQATLHGDKVVADRAVGECLTRAGLVDVALAAARRRGVEPDQTGDWYRCDQVWATHRLAATTTRVETVDTGLSDHRLIIAELELPGPDLQRSIGV